jgi:polycystin cation channel
VPQALRAANRYLGPLFFFMYILFVFFVLTNIFLAIISNSYDEIIEEACTPASLVDYRVTATPFFLAGEHDSNAEHTTCLQYMSVE